jgi:uncharacterized MAPEG superfamily protein
MPAAMSTEIVLLGWSVLLLLVQVVLQASLVSSELGMPYALGPRDEGREPKKPIARRSVRSLRNFLETYPAFIALALALAITGKTGGWGAAGAQIWFWARIAYVPAYLSGIPTVRTGIWGLSLAGLVLMLIQLLR